MNVNLTMYYYIGCCLYHNSLEMIGTKRLCCIVCENNVTKSNSDSVNTSKREIKTHLLKHHVILSYFYKCSSGFIMTRVQCWEEYTHTHTHTHTHTDTDTHTHKRMNYIYKCSSGFIMTRVQCWEEYFGNVMGYRLLKM